MGPRELRSGLFHWTAVHPKIQVEVSSYGVGGARLLLDPLLPPDAGGEGGEPGGLDWLRRHGPPEAVVLTNRHHWRHASALVEAFGCPVFVNALGLGEVAGEPGADRVRGFHAGDEVLPGCASYEVGVLCPDETALHIRLPDGSAALAVADGVVRIGAEARGDGPLCFVPDPLIADTPDEVLRVKRGLRAAYRRLCDLEFELLLLAHGLPVTQGARAALLAFCEGG